MNKLYSIWAGLVAVAMLASCAKTVETSQEDSPITIEEGMTFSASLGSATRSHFVDESSPALEWDADEPVMIAAARVSGFTDDMFSGDDAAATAALNTIIVSGIGHAEVNPEDKTQALIRTTKTQAQWLYSPEPDPSDRYLFFAYYPVSEVRNVFMQNSGEVYVDFEIPAEQDGRSYWKYQLFYDYKMENEDFVKYYTREGIESGTTEVTFEDFQPVTTLLRFRPKLPDGIEGSFDVKKIVLTASGTDRAIVGKCSCNIVENWLNPAAEGASMSLTLNLDEPVTVSSTLPEEYLYASIISQKDNGFAGTFNLTFSAYDANDELVLQATKTSPEGGLEAGKRYNFDLVMIPPAASAFSVSDLGEVPFDGMDWNATVTSYKTDPVTGQLVPLGYTVQAFADEACTQEATFSVQENTETGMTTYSISSFMSFELPTGHDFAAGTDLSETLAINFVGNPNLGQMVMTDASAEIRDVLRTATPVGSATEPYNLSNSMGEDAIQNAANCYMVHAPGYYRLPLVIGNAIENGEVNTGSFAWSGAVPEGARVCEHFHDYLDGEIDRPYVHESSEVVRTSLHVPTSVCILWEDVQNLIEADANFELAAPQADANGIYWLNFFIPPETIDQGNALIAVKDEEGTIMWSWHIWVTDYTGDQDVAFEGIEYDGNIASEELDSSMLTSIRYMMMQRNLGWVTTGRGSDTVFEPFEGYLLFTQDETGETVKVKVSVLGKTDVGEMENGDNPLFQWGRKDPIIGAAGLPKVGNFADKQVWGLTNTGGVSILNPETEEDATYGYAIQHADSWVSYDMRVYSTSYQKTNLWNVLSTLTSTNVIGIPSIKKSVYDPSPVGYCVPNPTVFKGVHAVFSEAYFNQLSQSNSELERLLDVMGNRLCAANEWGVTYFTDREHTGTVYLPLTNWRNDYGELFLIETPSGVTGASVNYQTSQIGAVGGTQLGGASFWQLYPLLSALAFQDLVCASPVRCVREDFTVLSTPSGIARPGKNGSTASSLFDSLSSLSLGGLSGASALPQWAVSPAMETIVGHLRQQ